MNVSDYTYLLPTKQQVLLATSAVTALSAVASTEASIQTTALTALLTLSTTLAAKCCYTFARAKTITMEDLEIEKYQEILKLEGF